MSAPRLGLGVPHTARDADIRCGLTNSFGFGGTNGALVLKKVDRS